MKINKDFYKILTLFGIFFLYILLRFYQLEKRIIFDWDQEQFSYQIKKVVVDHKLTLLGPRVNNDAGFFLAPYFTYLLLPFYLLTNLHPKALIYFIVFFNVLFFFITYRVINKIFGFWQAIFFLILWSINYQLINDDIIAWNPLLIPLGIIINWQLLYQIFKKNENKIWFFLGLTNGFFNHMHFQYIFVFLYSLIFLIFYQIKTKKLQFKKTLLFIFGYILMFFPLLLFDLRHQFLNTKAFIAFFFSNKSLVKDTNIWWQIWGYFLKPILTSTQVEVVKFFYFIFILLFLFLTKKKKDFYRIFYKSALFLWLIFPLAFSFYGQRPSEYYFLFLYPFIFITIIDLFFVLKRQLILLILMLLLIFYNRISISQQLQNEKQSLFYKDLTAKKIKQLVNGKKFNISFSTPLGLNHGFSYLIDWYQIKQTGNFKDPLVEIKIPPRNGDVKINDKIGIKIPRELK